ncbi:hypothetical protein D3C83_107080 [compost metagenome]
MFLGLYVGGALEHQVFEEMRETGAAGFFVFGADVEPDLYVDHRRGMVFVGDDSESVRKPGLFIFQRTWL